MLWARLGRRSIYSANLLHIIEEKMKEMEEREYADEGVGIAECETFPENAEYKNLPLVVIAGRPNVGKSTLFNRLLKMRKAITDPTPGVTRDMIEEKAFLCGKPVRLMDTGGFKLDGGAGGEAKIDALVTEKTLQAIKAADCIVLLLEAGEITAEDEEFIAILRPHWDKVLGCVNKTEGGRRTAEAWNALALGFNQLFFISAEHGDNVQSLAEAIAASLDYSSIIIEENRGAAAIKIAIAGKPNTGKSTLANLLAGCELSIVSAVAGTTRDVVEGGFSFKGRDFALLDTAGIRKKSRVSENVEYYSVNRAIKAVKNADIVFHVIDAGEGLADQDKKIVFHACEAGAGVIFVLNKWDTMPAEKRAFKDAAAKMRVMFAKMEYAPIIRLSALKGEGVAELLNAALALYGQLSTRVETSALNMALADWQEAFPPPASSRGRCRIKYMTQVRTNPVKFLLFATRPDALPQQYLSYLSNCIRRDFGFSQIPLLLELKQSRKSNGGAK